MGNVEAFETMFNLIRIMIFLMVTSAVIVLLLGVLLNWLLIIQEKNNRQNALFTCGSCSRHVRRHQLKLKRAANDGLSLCPHCNKVNPKLTKIPFEQEDKWMKSHPDCNKLGFMAMAKMERLIRKVKKSKKNDDELARFMEYNNLKPDLAWLTNLQKDLEPVNSLDYQDTVR